MSPRRRVELGQLATATVLVVGLVGGARTERAMRIAIKH